MEASGSGQRSGRLGKALQALLSLVIVGGIFLFVLPKIADYDDVWRTIADMTSLEVVTLVFVAAWNLVTYWFVLVSVLPGLTYPKAAVVNQASTAIANTIPGGGALGVGVTYAMYTSWGFSKGSIALSVLVSGIFNNFVKLGYPLIALALLAIEGQAGGALIAASLAGVAMLIGTIVGFGLILKSDRLARIVGNLVGGIVSRLRRLVRKPPVDWADAASEFRANTIDLLHDRWLWVTLATLVSHTSLYVVLLIALRHVGVSQADVTWIEVLAAFAFIRLISALPITPGGVGIVELGYVAILAELGGDLAQMTEAGIVAAVLVFRFLTFAMPVPLGAASYVVWRRNKRWRTPDDEEA